jgi:hypothetical protein
MNDVLAATYRRGRILKARRIGARATPALAAALVLTVAVAAAAPDRSARTRLVSPVTTPAPAVTTTTTPPMVADVVTSTTAPARQAPRQAAAPPEPTTTTTEPGPLDCLPGEIDFTVTTDRFVYAGYEWLVIIGTARNVSHHTCTDPPMDHWFMLDESGRRVVGSYSGDSRASGRGPLAPGEAHTFQRNWDKQICGEPGMCVPYFPGTYRIEMLWSTWGRAVSEPFVIERS